MIRSFGQGAQPFRKSTLGVWVALASAALAPACTSTAEPYMKDEPPKMGSGGGGMGAAPGQEELPSGEECRAGELLGRFDLILKEKTTSYSGSVFDRVGPSYFQTKSTRGDCELSVPSDLFCETPCESGTVCAGENQCVPEAMAVSAGLVSFAGLSAQLSGEPQAFTLQYNGDLDGPYPGFSVGSKIELIAEGVSGPGFELVGEGVGVLTSPSETINLVDGKDVSVIWDRDGASDQSAVEVALTINTHGGVPAKILCYAEDTGSLEIPSTLVEQLKSEGLSGFPELTLTRFSLDSTEIEGGCVEFRVTTQVKLPVSLDGFVSCGTNEDCPMGQACNTRFFCE